MTAWYAYALQIANGNLEALKLASLLVNFLVNFTFILCQHQLNYQPFFFKKNNIGVASCS